MHFNLNYLPERTMKPREYGLTMVMDKGMPLDEVRNILHIAGNYIDIVKLGFGTAFVTPDLREKLAIYKEHNIPVYFGGTLFEAFIVRDQYNDYKKMLETYEVEMVEVSDGSIEIGHDQKCEYIRDLSNNHTVLSEVGSKDTDKIIPPYKWIELMTKELESGSYKVIAEARESGTVGIFRGSGEVRSGLVDEILTQIPAEKIIWEAPKKQQQVWFIHLLGENVNLGNIAPNEVIPLETLRLGLRGDTFEYIASKMKAPNFRSTK